MLLVAYGLIPIFGTSYLFEAILLPFLALSLAALGLNILTGYAGQLSLGSAAFMAVGAFAAYNFNLRIPGLPLIVSLILAGATAAAFGILFGLPSLRLRGFYLAVSTLAAQFFVKWALTRFGWLSNYNSSGVIDAPPLTLVGVKFEGPLGRYLFALTVVVVVTAFAARLVSTRSGRNFIAIRDNEIAAKVFGVSIFRTKLLAFGVSSFIIGVAGFLWAFAYLRTVEPDGFNLDRSFSILFIIIIGGLASIRGAFFGAALIVVFPLVLSRLGALLLRRRVRLGRSRHEPAHRHRRAHHCLPHRRTQRTGRLVGSADDEAARTSLTPTTPPRSKKGTIMTIATRTRTLGIAAALSLAALGALGAPDAARADEQYFPLQSYRVGPYAAGGTGFFGGFIDYLNLINIRDGGVNGVKLTWDECETQYEVERGVECYERQKSHANIAAWNPLSVGIAYAMIDRITADKTPLITVNHGRTDSTDGRVFPYVFPLLLNPYSETSGIINYLAGREGGLDKLKGKKIVVLYHGSPYGRETIPIYELLAQKYGFTVSQLEVPHPGNEQQAQWLTIRREKPNYVVLRGWGVMNPVALKTAQKTGFPADHIIGNVWSNSEEDVIPAGDAAKGYTAITTQASGSQYPVLQEVVKTIYGAGKGNLEDKKRIGSVYHNLGIVNGILNVEAIRVAQEKFGHRTLTGDEVRWGFEHLKLDPARVEALGAKDLFHSINVTWDNHEGDGRVTFQQWDGAEVEGGLRLDRARLAIAATDHREVV